MMHEIGRGFAPGLSPWIIRVFVIRKVKANGLLAAHSISTVGAYPAMTIITLKLLIFTGMKSICNEWSFSIKVYST